MKLVREALERDAMTYAPVYILEDRNCYGLKTRVLSKLTVVNVPGNVTYYT